MLSKKSTEKAQPQACQGWKMAANSKPNHDAQLTSMATSVFPTLFTVTTYPHKEHTLQRTATVADFVFVEF
jgi:hypothetical protein